MSADLRYVDLVAPIGVGVYVNLEDGERVVSVETREDDDTGHQLVRVWILVPDE